MVGQAKARDMAQHGKFDGHTELEDRKNGLCSMLTSPAHDLLRQLVVTTRIMTG